MWIFQIGTGDSHTDWPGILTGGLIGGVFGILGGLIPYLLGERKKRKEFSNLVIAWRTGLTVELQQILTDIGIIRTNISANAVSTKRLNYDFLESTRTKWCEYDQEVTFLAGLSDTYRNVVHTNDMLQRYEDRTEKITEEQKKQGIGADNRQVLGSLTGVEDSVKNLKTYVDEKLTVKVAE